MEEKLDLGRTLSGVECYGRLSLLKKMMEDFEAGYHQKIMILIEVSVLLSGNPRADIQ